MSDAPDNLKPVILATVHRPAGNLYLLHEPEKGHFGLLSEAASGCICQPESPAVTVEDAVALAAKVLAGDARAVTGPQTLQRLAIACLGLALLREGDAG